MSSAQIASLEPALPAVRWKAYVRRWFYFWMALLFAVVVVWGFSHSVGSNLIYASVPRPTVLWVHAGVFCAWIPFYVLQSALVRSRHVRLHRTLGWFGTALAAAMVVLGFWAALTMGHFRQVTLHEAGAAVFAMVSFFDITSFGVLMTLAILWRRKPELHRRLIFVASAALLAAAFGRFDAILNHRLWYGCVDMVVLLGVLRDGAVDGRVHKVYRWALPAMILGQIGVIYVITHAPAWWVRLTGRMMG